MQPQLHSLHPALKRELASIRGALASLNPAASQPAGDPIVWAEHIGGLTLAS